MRDSWSRCDLVRRAEGANSSCFNGDRFRCCLFCGLAPAFSAPLSTFTASGSFQSITPASMRFSTAAACSDGVGVISVAVPLAGNPQLLTGLRGAAMPLFKVKGSTATAFGTIRHSDVRVIECDPRQDAGRKYRPLSRYPLHIR